MSALPLPAPRRPVALALMVLAPFLWSLAGVLQRQVHSAGGFEMAFWRSSVAALFVFCALAFLQGGRPFATLRAAGIPGLVSGAMWAIMFSAFMLALMTTTTWRTVAVCEVTGFSGPWRMISATRMRRRPSGPPG